MQIQNFDLGMAALRPMVTAQEMDIRSAQEGRARESHPLEMKRLAALAEWDVTRAAEKRQEMEGDAALSQFMKDFQPSKAGLPHEQQLAEMSMGLLRQGKVNEAKKLADISNGITSTAAMEEQRQATAEMRRANAERTQQTMWNQTLSAIDAGNVGDVLGRLAQQGMPKEDLDQFAKMAYTTDVMGRKVPNPQGIATIQKMSRSWRDMAMADAKAEAQAALERDRAERLKRMDASLGLQQQGLNIRANLAELARIRTETYVKNAGKNVPEASALDIKQANTLIAADEELMDQLDMSPEEAFAFASAVAERAKGLKARNQALLPDEALAKAKDEVVGQLVQKPSGRVVTALTELFGRPPPNPKLTYKGPPKTAAPQANITKEEYDRLPKGAKFWWNGKEVVKGN